MYDVFNSVEFCLGNSWLLLLCLSFFRWSHE